MLPFLRDLLAHAEWANAMFFHAWGKSPARDHEEMRRRVGHILDVQQAFLAMMRGETPARPAEGQPPPSFDDLKARAVASHTALRDFAAALDQEALARTVRIPWFPDPASFTLAEALVQVAMHTQHHRGQLMTRLKDFGGEPKNVDWIIWVWKQKPQGRWS
jgi:uncharacterized damage-inducible protein DinB